MSPRDTGLAAPPQAWRAGQAGRYVYTVRSRRARGLSVGVNLSTDQACTFDCPYCQVDRTAPPGPREVDLERLVVELRAELLRLRAASQEPADIAFAGDGEPTAAPAFAAAAAAVCACRDELCPDVPLRLLTNATRLRRPAVRAALAHFDELWCKLDAGSEEHFRRASGSRFPLERILANVLSVARVRPVVVQCLFFRHCGGVPGPAEIEAWVERLRELKTAGAQLACVQVYTVARRPARATVSALEPEALEGIAGRVRALGIAVEVFP